MLCFVVSNRSEWGTVFYFQFAIFQYWTAVLKRKKKNSWINPVPLASFNTGAVEDVCGVALYSWWRSQWRLDWWAWCVLVWNQIFGEFVYVPVSVKRFLFVGEPDRLPRSSYLQWKKSGRNLLHFQLKVGVVVWFFPPFCVQLHSIDWCHCFSMYMYLQPEYCVSYSLNINNFCNFKTGGVLDCLLILCFLQLKYWLKNKKNKFAWLLIVFRDRGSVGPSKNWRWWS